VHRRSSPSCPLRPAPRPNRAREESPLRERSRQPPLRSRSASVPGPPRRSARWVAAGPWSPSRVAWTPASWRRCACAHSGPSTSVPAAPRARFGAGDQRPRARARRGAGDATAEHPITPALEALGCYAWRDAAIRGVFPDYEPGWPHKLVRSEPNGAVIVFSLRHRAPGRDDRAPARALRALPAAAGRAEHEAARSQAHRVHVGRPPALRRRRHAEPPGVRPGVSSSRAATGWPTSSRSRASTSARSTRSRASSACRKASPPASRRPTPSACPEPGGVLLRPLLRPDGHARLGRRQRRAGVELARAPA